MTTSGNAGGEKDEHTTIEEQRRRQVAAGQNNKTIKQFTGEGEDGDGKYLAEPGPKTGRPTTV